MTFLLLSLITKLGGAPLHFWVPQILEGCYWLNLTIILSWQKLAPFFLVFSLTSVLKANYLIIISAAMSGIIGGAIGLTHSSTRKILAFSSINHIGWILSATLLRIMPWLVYFMSYRIILLSLIFRLKVLNISTLSRSFSLSPKNKFLFFPLLLSFGGLPPFFGFLPKWILLSSLSSSSLILALVLALTKLLTLFFYLRISFNAFLRKSLAPSSPFSSNALLSIFFVINIFGLIIIPLI